MSNKKRTSYTLDEDLIIRLNVEAAKRNINKSELVEQFITEGLERSGA